MPFGDRTGPAGLGPMTGRGAGYCAGFGMPGRFNPWPRGRFWCWWGLGRGRGWRDWFWATGLPRWARFGFWNPFSPPITPEASKDAEREFLKREAEYLESALKEVKDRLAKLAEEKE